MSDGVDDSLPELPLPAGVKSAYTTNINGVCKMHYLSAGAEGSPLLLLLHGFPEIAYSWRHVLQPLADAGYHAVAPDLRGYGRSVRIGYREQFAEGDALVQFREMNRVRDMVCFVAALGYTECEVVGHDFGSTRAFWCALVRPDVFRSLTMMSAPISPPPAARVSSSASRSEGAAGKTGSRAAVSGDDDVHEQLRTLGRQHYQQYYCLAQANGELMGSNLNSFFRDYYHMKSADWSPNERAVAADLAPLEWSAAELSKLPTYYVMDMGVSMPETVAAQRPSAAVVTQHSSRWFTDADVAVYAAEYGRTGLDARTRV